MVVIRFSVCVETIFNELPLAERIERCAACGAAAFEFWSWRNKDLDTITRAKEAAGVDVAAFGALDDAFPNDPSTAAAAAADMQQAIEVARQIGATGLIVHAGQERDDVPRPAQLEGVARLLADAAPAANAAHITLLLEPLNVRIDCPGYLISQTADALAVIEQAGQPNVKMLFDIYHQYVTEGTVFRSIETHIDRIGHFHVADVPGRGEPGTGALDFGQIFGLIDSLEYAGYVGLEFRPSGDHMDAVKNTLDLI